MLLTAFFLLFQLVLSVSTELVAVPVTVTDAQGNHVPDLVEENFRVYEDGRLQPITLFHRGDMPLTIGIVVDRSQSMRGKGDTLTAAVSTLLESARPDDELFAVTFHDTVALAQQGGQVFTSDPGALAAAAAAISPGGRTALYDGVAEGLRQLALGHSQRTALVVVSDGGDNASRHTYAEILALARRSGAVIYGIGLMGTPPATEDEDGRLLSRLCKDTGGIAYFPRSVVETVAVSSQIGSELRNQYLLGFSPSGRSGRNPFRRITVRVDDRGRAPLSARARAGYMSAAQVGR
jgi:Ca-activated chloride channel family protein